MKIFDPKVDKDKHALNADDRMALKALKTMECSEGEKSSQTAGPDLRPKPFDRLLRDADSGFRELEGVGGR